MPEKTAGATEPGVLRPASIMMGDMPTRTAIPGEAKMGGATENRHRRRLAVAEMTGEDARLRRGHRTTGMIGILSASPSLATAAATSASIRR